MKKVEINIVHLKAGELVLKLKTVIRICLNVKLIGHIITIAGISGQHTA